MKKIGRIIKAKISSKENMEPWYYERKSKCDVCPHNSANVEKLSVGDQARIAHNMGKPACLICTCGIEDKCSDEQEQCPDSPPRWLAREAEQGEALPLSLVEGTVSLEYNKSDREYILNYGTRRPFSNTSVTLKYEHRGVSNVSVRTSCGCTTAMLSNNEIQINYRNNILGPINKKVTITYREDKIMKVTRIQLKGKIDKNGL